MAHGSAESRGARPWLPDGDRVSRWVLETARGVRAFYDFDTAATLASLEGKPLDDGGRAPRRMPIDEFDLYLSLTGGPLLARVRSHLSTTCARPLYCSSDPAWHTPMQATTQWELGYVASDARDERPVVERLMLNVARLMPERRFVVAGSIHDDGRPWPANVRRMAPVPNSHQRGFYARQRFALNLTPDTTLRPAGCTAPALGP